MKNYLVMAAAIVFMSSCNQKELAESNRQRDSLFTIVNEREATLNEFITTFNEVENNLDSVALKQNLISSRASQNGELNVNQKQHINSQIAAINNLMDENRKKLSDLNRKLKNSGRKNVALEKTIATITGQLKQKDIELTALNDKLNSLNAQVEQLQTSVDVLTEEGNAKSQTIANETMALHTAYYVIGKSGDLKDAKIIDRKGGLLGIGKTSKLSDNFDNSKFTRIDYTQTTSIAINSEIKIITNHPSNSYALDKNDKGVVEKITIINPERFWSVSKYLVIVKD